MWRVSRTTATYARKVTELYERLQGLGPGDVGVSAHGEKGRCPTTHAMVIR